MSVTSRSAMDGSHASPRASRAVRQADRRHEGALRRPRARRHSQPRLRVQRRPFPRRCGAARGHDDGGGRGRSRLAQFRRLSREDPAPRQDPRADLHQHRRPGNGWGRERRRGHGSSGDREKDPRVSRSHRRHQERAFRSPGMGLRRTCGGSRPPVESSGHAGQQHPELDGPRYAHQAAGEDAAGRSAHALLQRSAHRTARPENRADPAVHARGPPARRPLRSRARRRKLPLAGGGSGDEAWLSTRHDQHRHPQREHPGHPVGHAQLHVEDAHARHGAEGDHLSLHRDPGARRQSLSGDRHAWRGPGRRHRRAGARGRCVRLSRCLGDEAHGDAPNRQRAHGPVRGDRVRPRCPGVCGVGYCIRPRGDRGQARACPPSSDSSDERRRGLPAEARTLQASEGGRFTTCCCRTATSSIQRPAETGASTSRSLENGSRASRSTCRRARPRRPWTPARTSSRPA